MNDDPFAVLGLPTGADVSDDDVRAAWRRIAAATHPDRDDGGEPARFGAAAAAYALLRTAYGRGEALADLGAGGGAGSRVNLGAGGGAGGGVSLSGSGGGPGRRGAASWTRLTGALALRGAVAAVVAGLAFLAAGWAPSSIGVLAGLVTWLLVRYQAGEPGSWPVATGREGSAIQLDQEPR
jgi:DnaJ domain